jgi:hypothetical protein
MNIDGIDIVGAEQGDVTFTLNMPPLPNITWNVTRIQRDADAGKFGKPIRIARSEMPPLGPRERENVDWDKVRGMVLATADQYVNGVPIERTFLEKPVLHVLLRGFGHHTIRLPVDGNHRILARFIAGADDFYSYVVPAEQEADYRIRFYKNGMEVA